MGHKFLNALAILGVATLLTSGLLTATSAPYQLPAAADPRAAEQEKEPEFGVCVIGVESPCNGDDTGDDLGGICVIGVESPCNGPDYQGGKDVVEDAPKGTHEPWCIAAPCELPAEEEPRFGVCVIGVESPCNGDGEVVEDAPKGGREIHCIQPPCELAPEDPDYVPADGESTEPSFGICMIGVDSPCNGPGYGADYDPEAESNKTAEEPAFGICVVGADSPCNGEEYGAGYDAEAEAKKE